MDPKQLKKAAAAAAKSAAKAAAESRAQAGALAAEASALDAKRASVAILHREAEEIAEINELRARAARVIDRLADSGLLDAVLGKRSPTNEERAELVKRKLAQTNRGWVGPGWYWCGDLRADVVALYREITITEDR